MSDCPDCGAPNVPCDGYVTHCGRMLHPSFASMAQGWKASMERNQICKAVGEKRKRDARFDAPDADQS